MAMYLEAVTVPDPEGDFDPKFKQKAVYRWYDARYSDEALDIYSTEWRDRIMSWHEHAVKHTATAFSSEELLERLEFGNFFLAHPIAAFSLWQVLQACYELDRIVCGVSDEVISWQKLPPFQYFRDSRIQAQWLNSLEQLRESIKSGDLDSNTEYTMYEMGAGVEKFESAFQALKENFSINLSGMKFAIWMVDRIDGDIGKRFAMITDQLSFKDQELQNIRPTDSNDAEYAAEYATGPSHPGNSKAEWKKKCKINKKSRQKQKAATEPKPHKKLTTILKSGFGTLRSKHSKPEKP